MDTYTELDCQLVGPLRLLDSALTKRQPEFPISNVRLGFCVLLVHLSLFDILDSWINAVTETGFCLDFALQLSESPYADFLLILFMTKNGEEQIGD